MLKSLAENLLTPLPMCFALGIFSKMIHGGIKIPKELYYSISIYLLMSIGIIGGHELAHEYQAHGVSTIWKPALVTLFLGCLTPITAYGALRYLGRLNIADAAGIAAHYGSTSAVTFIVADGFCNDKGYKPDGYLPTLVTILECPGIAVALVIGAVAMGMQKAAEAAAKSKEGQIDGAPEAEGGNLWEALHEVITGQSLMLMVGLLVIGFISTFAISDAKFHPYEEFFYNKNMIFRGALCIFLLEMGLVTGERLGDLLKVGPFLIAFGIIMPLFHGFLGAFLGYMAGMNLGGCTVLAAIVSSASYIAAPPAVRLTLPEANPTLSMTASLAITFPFNIALGIPIYFWMAQTIGAK
ncbi:MAG: sodium-dependent bicarbonate transport family permease [Planctomycetes bacterium]|nr:sodium-dependent bicarbonate transport family permease [Planctomycetota bacterium]